MEWLYFILLGCSLAFPLAWSFEKRVSYYKSWKPLFIAIGLTAAFFLVWDVWFTERGVWGFSENYTRGFKLFNLPIEEVLFFVIIPFSSVFIYACVGYFLPGQNTSSNRFARPVSLGLGVALLVVAMFNFSRAYTFWNFLFTGTFLLFIAYRNPVWLSRFWIAYLYHLIPFFIVNGILTGSFIQDEIVWYNNAENLSIRMFTIPIEDSMYALLLLLMNVNYFELFKTRFST